MEERFGNVVFKYWDHQAEPRATWEGEETGQSREMELVGAEYKPLPAAVHSCPRFPYPGDGVSPCRYMELQGRRVGEVTSHLK